MSRFSYRANDPDLEEPGAPDHEEKYMSELSPMGMSGQLMDDAIDQRRQRELDRDKLADLLAKVKAAGGPDRELDLAIWNATNTHPCSWHPGFPEQTVVEHNRYGDGAVGNPVYTLDPFTASVDAALALVERMLPQASPGVSQSVHHITWHSWMGYVNADGQSDTLGEATHEYSAPLAILAATLTALSQEPSP